MFKTNLNNTIILPYIFLDFLLLDLATKLSFLRQLVYNRYNHYKFGSYIQNFTILEAQAVLLKGNNIHTFQLF